MDETFTDSLTGVASDSITGCGTTTVTLSDTAANMGTGETIDLSFSGVTNTVNALNGTVAPYGSFTATCVTGCVADATQIGVPGSDFLTFTVTITETSPDHMSGSAGEAQISGGIANDSSSLSIGAYTLSPVMISNTDVVTYTLDTSDHFNAPSSLGPGDQPGLTGVQMTITDRNAVNGTAPETASLAMMGSGLLALGLMSRRRRKS